MPRDTTVIALDQAFRRDSTARAVVVPFPEAPVLIERWWFEMFLSGRLGYGRLLYGRHTLAELPSPRTLVVDQDDSVATVAAEIIEHRGTDASREFVVVVDGDGAFAVAAVTEVFERLAIHYAHQSLHDPLTGLPNRGYLAQRLAEMNREQVPALLFYIDLDRFKDVNDSLGHAAGDRVLCDFADRLRSLSRAEDLVVRLGGDEFALVAVDDMSTGEALALAERLVLDASAPFHLTLAVGDGTVDHVVSIGASVGIAHSDRRIPDSRLQSLDVLLRQADLALYRAKARGRGRVERFDDDLMPSDERDQTTRAEHSMERRLRAAMADERLTLHYQPQVSFPHGAVVGAEALARWHDPELGSVPPDQFIALAERCGLILDLGRWILRAACREAATWADAIGCGPSVSVNVSPLQIAEPSIVSEVAAALRDSGLPPHRLCLEITETAAISDLDETAARLAELGDLGVRIALDDFGTGYSSLTMLRRLPVHLVKIDRTFVRDIGTSASDAVLVRLVVDTAHSLGLAVCAEGVEDVGQAEQLIALGCDLAQGWYFGMPEPPSARLLVNLRHSGAVDPRPPVDSSRQYAAAHNLMPGSDELVLVLDAERSIVYASATCRSMVGAMPHELVGTSVRDHLHPDEVDHLAATWADAVADGGARIHRIGHRDGSFRWLSTTSRSLRGGPDGRDEVLTVSRDVTAVVAAQADVERNNERFKVAFDEAPIGMSLSRLDGRLLRVNDALAALLGRTPAEVEGWSVADITHPADIEADNVNLAALTTNTDRHVVRKRYRHTDGHDVEVCVWTARVGEPHDPEAYVLAHVLPAEHEPSWATQKLA